MRVAALALALLAIPATSMAAEQSCIATCSHAATPRQKKSCLTRCSANKRTERDGKLTAEPGSPAKGSPLGRSHPLLGKITIAKKANEEYSAVQARVHDQLPALAHCASEALGRSAKFEGTVSLVVEVAKSGALTTKAATGHSDLALCACVKKIALPKIAAQLFPYEESVQIVFAAPTP